MLIAIRACKANILLHSLVFSSSVLVDKYCWGVLPKGIITYSPVCCCSINTHLLCPINLMLTHNCFSILLLWYKGRKAKCLLCFLCYFLSKGILVIIFCKNITVYHWYIIFCDLLSSIQCFFLNQIFTNSTMLYTIKPYLVLMHRGFWYNNEGLSFYTFVVHVTTLWHIPKNAIWCPELCRRFNTSFEWGAAVNSFVFLYIIFIVYNIYLYICVNIYK